MNRALLVGWIRLAPIVEGDDLSLWIFFGRGRRLIEILPEPPHVCRAHARRVRGTVVGLCLALASGADACFVVFDFAIGRGLIPAEDLCGAASRAARPDPRGGAPARARSDC